MPHPPQGSPIFEFGAGLLDDDPGVDVAYHIYVGSRAPWCELQDDILGFDEMGGLSEAQLKTIVVRRRRRVAPKSSQ